MVAADAGAEVGGGGGKTYCWGWKFWGFATSGTLRMVEEWWSGDGAAGAFASGGFGAEAAVAVGGGGAGDATGDAAGLELGDDGELIPAEE